METKLCKACEIEKELEEFQKTSRNPLKLSIRCKICVKNKIPSKKECLDENVKRCTKCSVIKSKSMFCKNINIKEGIKGECKDCEKKYRELNKEKLSVSKKEYTKNNKYKRKEWEAYNKQKISDYRKMYRKENLEALVKYDKERNIRDVEKKAIYNKQYKIANKEKLRKQSYERNKQRMATDVIYKLSHNTRELIRKSFKRGGNQYRKGAKTENILGCTIIEFIEHLESLFTEGMNLDNNGNCEECWHIDHKIPISSAKTEEEIIKLNHYTNLQPLWSRDNLMKSNK